jgi:hypothetical protein
MPLWVRKIEVQKEISARCSCSGGRDGKTWFKAIPGKKTVIETLSQKMSWVWVVHVYNPSYTGDRGTKIVV